MIKIPAEILTTEELEQASGRKGTDIDIEFTNVTVQKDNLVLSVDTKLNFAMPKNIECLMKERIKEKIGTVNFVRINYVYTGIKQVEHSQDEENVQPGNFYRRKKEEPKAFTNSSGEMVVLGKDFSGKSISFNEAIELVGSKDKAIIEGEVFKIDSRPIKNERVLLTILIVNSARTFCMKAFISTKKNNEIIENLGSGDSIMARGSVEFDTYDHENTMMVDSIKKVEKKQKEDTYPNGRRVELHCHSKMSDNDGFNEVADIVNTAAAWGQPAVAITDHGVVQGFPDAAKAAAKLESKGKKIKVIYGVEGYLYPDEDATNENGEIDIKKNKTYHIIILAKNQEGIKSIYKLVSKSHIDYFHKRPRIPRSLLNELRENLIIGSACEAGELYRAVLNGESDDKLLEIASFYDYLEIQP